jgi:hypothetical protein
MFAKLTAEHINRKRGEDIIKQAEDTMDLHVLHAGHDDVFTDLFHIVVEATQKEVNKLRDYIWTKNNGASCEIVKDWTEELDWDAGWL